MFNSDNGGLAPGQSANAADPRTARLHPLARFGCSQEVASQNMPVDWYEGYYPNGETLHRLPRTLGSEAIARRLMHQLTQDNPFPSEGKMYGVLLVRNDATGQLGVLISFSGLLDGQADVPGWVPPIPGRAQVALAESQTLARLEQMKQELIALHHLPERQRYQELAQFYETARRELGRQHGDRKQQRQQQRQELTATLQGAALAAALESLNEASRQDGMARRRLKQQQDAILAPLKATIDQADAAIRQLKHQRRELSRQLQAQMHATYWLTNFAGETRFLHQLMPTEAMPTGTGDCCAPKLLHHAAIHRLTPLALAEFWWGPPSPTGERRSGEFYGACRERCQPLMGFLLAGSLAPTITGPPALPILFEDAWLIAVNKPAGLLSVPGRSPQTQDSVVSRLRCQRPDLNTLVAVHRLDQDTSGVLLLARNRDTLRHLQRQFHQRSPQKTYDAILTGEVAADRGMIDLPLWSDPGDRPRQKVDHQRGKPSQTAFQVLTRQGGHSRVVFTPLTGRTHQIRVHAADPQGLGMPIVGDRLYGNNPNPPTRLHLHARTLQIHHPQRDRPLHLEAETPF
ncbi:MAG: RluA family pseudouridine synthase [Synechococcales bacterium]|nr:RluA family pseudouridine synthase [Synechococcales bacterium]